MGASCAECFKETSPLYTCNPNNPTCQKQALLGAYDTVTNTGNTNLVMYDGHEGSINFYTMQTSNVSWSQSGTIASMFQFPSAYENGRENFSV